MGLSVREFKAAFREYHSDWCKSHDPLQDPILKQKDEDGDELIYLTSSAREMYESIANHYESRGVNIVATQWGFLQRTNFDLIQQKLAGDTLTGLMVFNEYYGDGGDGGHVTPFLVGKGMIISPLHSSIRTSVNDDEMPETVLKIRFPIAYFSANNNQFHPQSGERGCAMLSAKILKSLLSNEYYGQSSMIVDHESKSVIPHPMAFRHTMSNQFFYQHMNSYCNALQGEENNDVRVILENHNHPCSMNAINIAYQNYKVSHFGKDGLGYATAKHSCADDREAVIDAMFEIC